MKGTPGKNEEGFVKFSQFTAVEALHVPNPRTQQTTKKGREKKEKKGARKERGRNG